MRAAVPALSETVSSVVTSAQESSSRPDWLQDIRLEGLGGAVSNRLAIINRKTLAIGEGATIKVSKRDVYIRCLDISGEIATITVAGIEKKLELRLSGD